MSKGKCVYSVDYEFNINILNAILVFKKTVDALNLPYTAFISRGLQIYIYNVLRGATHV